MRDLLIRYLMGELSDVEKHHVEARLQESPELRRELEHLRACFSSAEEKASGAEGAPPHDMAQRVTEQVTSLPDETLSVVSAQLVSRASADSASGSMSWSLADLAVAAGVFLAVSMLVLPALRGSRDTARRHLCAQNQKELGYAFTRYAADNGGLYPRVELRDPAGVFASLLVDEGYIELDEIKQLLLCPASHQREAHFDGDYVMMIPSAERLRSAVGAERETLLQKMLFSYAYRLGFVEKNTYHCVRKRKRSCEPILADAPIFDAYGLKIVNHGGLGFNVLFGDGHVDFRREVAIPGDKNIYLNLYEKPAAGQGQNDIVLAPSATSPGVELSTDAGK